MILNASRALIGPDLEIVEPAVISIDGTRIGSMGSDGSAPEVIDLPNVTLLPGFIDTHVHIGLVDPGEVLRRGVTTVRDLAWPPEDIYPLSHASRAPTFDGPRILCVGPMLTVEGGYPTRAAWAPPGTGRVVASHEDAHAAVEELAGRGVAAIKVALNAQVGPTLDAPTLSAICDAAHAHGLRVTAHIYGLIELVKAIEAGVDELAHVLMSPDTIPDEVIATMVSKDIVIVPTLSIFSGRSRRFAIDNVARFVAAGGRVLYGTDLGNEGPRPGIERREIEGMTAAGLGGRRVAAAATTTAARILGLERKGVLAAGYDADIIGVAGDPVARPSDLCDVRFVMREGRVIVPG